MIKVKFYFNDNKGSFIEYAKDEEELRELIECNQYITESFERLEETEIRKATPDEIYQMYLNDKDII